jgi:hypothetical protein
MTLTIRHCEERSDEAIQPVSADAFLDCFASRAMTEKFPQASFRGTRPVRRSSTSEGGSVNRNAQLRIVESRTTQPAVIARLDRAIQYAATYRLNRTASGILDPRWSLSSGSPKARPGGGDDSGNCISRSDANELS